MTMQEEFIKQEAEIEAETARLNKLLIFAGVAAATAGKLQGGLKANELQFKNLAK